MRLAGRSPREFAFRLRQAVANAEIWAFPPSISRGFAPAALNLPEPETVRARLAGSAFQDELVSLANQILERRMPMFGRTFDVDEDIDWRRDYVSGKSSGGGYFRFIPYLDFEAVGDHKNIWELNRHQHLVVLAQAHFLTGTKAYRDDIVIELESWWEQNPFLQGINWTSALEVAFRSLSWLWIDHISGTSLDESFRRRMWNSLYQHGSFIECNLSTYFSPNTHLLGEGVALHAIGVKLKREKWRALGAKVVEEELTRQVAADGSHFEQSTYYHLYALDFFLLHYLLAGRPAVFAPTLRKMAAFLAAIIGPARLLTFIGDDDGGRVFHPYGVRELFGRATLATCKMLFPEEGLPFENEDLAAQAEWWLTPRDVKSVPIRPITKLFPNSGLAAIASSHAHILVDAGSFGFGGAGHSHADTLSISVRSGARELLIDPGTFTYMSDARLRNQFRGTGFHNTIRLDGRDQANPQGPFRWENKPSVHVNNWKNDAEATFLDASCRYRKFTHRRRVLCLGEEWLFVLDEVTGPEGEHVVEQFWHLGDPDVPVLLSDTSAATREQGLRSRVMGQCESAPVICARWTTVLPHLCAAALPLDGISVDGLLIRTGSDLLIAGLISVSFGNEGMPVVTRV